MSDWQPISTAPKDETWVLLYTANDGAGGIVMGCWDAGCDATEDDPGYPAGWMDAGGFFLHPTHWMPLPEPPK